MASRSPSGAPGRQPARDRVVHVEGDRDRPDGAVGEAHRLADGVVVGAPEEAAQRREAPRHQQLEVERLAKAERPGRPVVAPGEQLAAARRIDHEVDQRPAVRRDQLVGPTVEAVRRRAAVPSSAT